LRNFLFWTAIARLCNASRYPCRIICAAT
jgi:hypothetical protein